MNRDEITVFRDARPEVPPYDPDAKARARARLGAAPARRPLVGRRRLLTVGALTAGLAVGITVVQNIEFGSGDPQRKSGPLMLGPVASAADLAGNATRKAASEPAAIPGPKQWSYVKTVLASSSKGVGGSLSGPPDRRVTSERWSRADGRQTAVIEKGRLVVRDEAGQMVASPRSDLPYLLSLPADPGAMLARVHQVAAQEGPDAKPAERDARAFQILEVFMRDAALPPRLRAAMYGALARIPGVRYEARAADIAGRRGVTLYRVEEGYLRSEILVDPRTYEYMGFRNVAIRDHVSRALDGERRVRKGQILGWGGATRMGYVDRAGQRP